MRRGSYRIAYDPATDPLTWRGYNPAKARAFRGDRPKTWKEELSDYKGFVGLKKHKMKISASKVSKKKLHEECEKNLEESVRRSVGALEAALEAAYNTESMNGVISKVNRLILHNTILTLKTKCGLKFEDSSHQRRVPLDRQHLVGPPRIHED